MHTDLIHNYVRIITYSILTFVCFSVCQDFLLDINLSFRNKQIYCIFCVYNYRFHFSDRRAQIRAQINQKLMDTGERERLKELLRQRLNDCGWRDQLKAHCKGEKKVHLECNDVINHCITLPVSSISPEFTSAGLMQDA